MKKKIKSDMSSIGETLKKAREHRHLSLEAVAHATKIHFRVLESLEDDEFDNLPSALYVKSFLKKYSEFLGLNSADILEKYLSLHPHPAQQAITIEKKEKIKPVLKFKPIIIVLGLFLALAGLFFSLRFIFIGHKNKSVTTARAAMTKRAVSKTETATVPSVNKRATLLLKVLAKKDTWLELKSDGSVVFQHILRQGTEESWEAKDRFELSVNEANNISLHLNGKPLGKLGSGVKRGIVITDKGLLNK